MNRRITGLFIFAATVLLFFVSPIWAEYVVGLTHGTNKHRPEFGFEPLGQYRIHSAQNEWEPFQVLIRDDGTVANVNVSVTEFMGPGDPITAVELYRVHYVPVPADQISHDPPDPTRAGDWPDGSAPGPCARAR